MAESYPQTTVRIDPALKARVVPKLRALGLTVSDVANGALREFDKTGELPETPKSGAGLSMQEIVALTSRRGADPVESLADLRGPSSGKVQLHNCLDWSPRGGDFDVEDDLWCVVGYASIIREGSQTECASLINGARLKELWPRVAMRLPSSTRERWLEALGDELSD